MPQPGRCRHCNSSLIKMDGHGPSCGSCGREWDPLPDSEALNSPDELSTESPVLTPSSGITVNETQIDSSGSTAEGERVETGPLQIGDDWPGLFIRGDNAFAWALTIHEGARHVEDGVVQEKLMGLVRFLRSCTVEGGKDPEHLRLLALAPTPRESERYGWAVEENVRCVVCPDCAFTPCHDLKQCGLHQYLLADESCECSCRPVAPREPGERELRAWVLDIVEAVRKNPTAPAGTVADVFVSCDPECTVGRNHVGGCLTPEGHSTGQIADPNPENPAEVSDEVGDRWAYIGFALRRARVKREVSLRELAERVGITPVQLGTIERGVATVAGASTPNLMGADPSDKAGGSHQAPSPRGWPARYDCGECEAEGVKVDEDGCCVTCGIVAAVTEVPGGRWVLLAPSPESPETGGES